MKTIFTHRNNISVFLIFFATLIFSSCVSYIAKGGNIFDDLPFNEVVWKENAGNWGTDNDRGKMVESLQSILNEKKLNKLETIELLGEPEDAFINDYEEERDILLYSIGWWTGYGIDPDTFDIVFDMDGNFINSFVHQH